MEGLLVDAVQRRPFVLDVGLNERGPRPRAVVCTSALEMPEPSHYRYPGRVNGSDGQLAQDTRSRENGGATTRESPRW